MRPACDEISPQASLIAISRRLGQLHRLGRHAARDHPVGVAVAHRLLPGRPRLVQAGARRDAQHVIGVARGAFGTNRARTSGSSGSPMPKIRATSAGTRLRSGDSCRRPPRSGTAPRAGRPAPCGRRRRTSARDLAGIGVEPRHVLPRQVEDAGGVRLFARRDGEDLAEGRHLVRGSPRRRPWPSWRPSAMTAMVKPTDCSGRARAAGRTPPTAPSPGKGGQGVGDAGPDRHGRQHSGPGRGCQVRIFCISTRSM